MAKLPESKERKKISQMEIGESCYTSPWSMFVDEKGNCFIDETCQVILSPEEANKELKITRVEGGYIAYIYDIDFKWARVSLSEDFDDDFDDYDKPVYKPVVGFKTKSYNKLSKKELAEQLEQLVKEENYEKAAKIRDKIKKLEKNKPPTRKLKLVLNKTK